jgi:ATP phosphoribosyltransferase regulatory subunit HisZ
LFFEEILSSSEVAGALLTLLATWKVLRIHTPTTEPISSLLTTPLKSEI